MKQISVFFLITITVAILASSCNDSTVVGSGLLGSEDLDIKFTDTITIRAKTVEDDSVATYRRTVDHQTYMLGILDDPFFGRSSSDLYLEVSLGTALPNYTYQADNGAETMATFDSLVLILNYDTLGFYGDTLARHNLEVFQMEELFTKDTFYSNESLMTGMMPIGGLNSFIPSPRDSVSYFDPTSDSIIMDLPQIRIRLDNALGMEIMNNTDENITDSLFIDLIKGLYLKSTPDQSSMFGVNLNITSNLTLRNKLSLYYTDTLPRVYNYQLTGRTFSNFEHDYTGSSVEPFLEDYDLGDSLLFIQSMAGVDARFDLDGITQLSEKLINHAELELTIAELNGDDLGLYDPITSVIASELSDDGDLVLIRDATLAISVSNTLNAFGGFLGEEELNGISIKKVKMNVTNHVIDILDDPSIGTEIFISAFSKSERPNRSIIFGPGNSMFPAKLNITYTNP